MIAGWLMKMNIKRRLAVSNLLMLLIPVAVVLAAGIVFLVILFSMLNSDDFRFGEERFYDHKDEIVGLIEEGLGSDSPTDSLNALVDSAGQSDLRIVISENGNTVYEAGNYNASDEELLAMSEGEKGVFVSNGVRQLYTAELLLDGRTLGIAIFCNYSAMPEQALETVLAVMVFGLLILVIICIIFANRLLSRFVFHKIEQPLDKLLAGAREVASGNLGYRIEYDENDEFRPAIDEFNTMTEKLKNSVEMLKDEENSRQMLIVGITHDIKSPLTSIIGYVEGLCDGVADTQEKRLRYLKVIRRKCDEINALVTKMIVLTKSEYELSNVNESVLPDAEIKNFIAANGEEYRNKGLQIFYSGESVPKLKISAADFSRLLVNIADNSLKYKNGAEGRLRIDLHCSEGKTVLAFSDDGQGVSDEDLPHLFEAFYRADRARTMTESGNGLGLAIVKKIITAAGGEVSACKNEQGGLTVRAVF